MNILLTDGDERSTLAVARDLARDRHRLIVGHTRRTCLAGASRFVAERFVYPHPGTRPGEFLECLVDRVGVSGADVLIPTTDMTVSLVLANRELFQDRVMIPFPRREAWALASDKVNLLAAAERFDIPVPRTVVLTDPGEAPQLPDDFFPAVLKSRTSGFWNQGNWVKGRVRRLDTRAALPRAFADFDPAAGPFLLQEEVQGPGIGLFLLISDGAVRAAFAHRRVREKPPAGGVSTCCVSTPLPPELFDPTVSLLRSLDWSGVAMVEFKHDLRDGKAKLMEINGRFWGSLQLAVSAGVRFPSLLARILAGEKPPPVLAYRHKKLQWILGDLDHVIAVAVRGRTPPHAPPHARLSAVLGFLACLSPGVCRQVFSLRDPRPWLYEAWNYVRYPRGKQPEPEE